MASIPEDSLQAKAYGPDSIRIQCADLEFFQIVQKYFTVTQTEIHTFSLFSERSLNIVIMGLLRSITNEEIFEELKTHGYEVTSSCQFGKLEKKDAHSNGHPH